jgi:major membrane immunogen (membrane-anchored lipoprotein)
MIICLCCVFISGCGAAKLKDGVFSGKSSTDDTGAWGEITITIKQGMVSGCVFITRQKDGTVKAEDYGKVNGEISNAAFYEKAQLAVRAMKRYAQQYAETGRLDAVDSISGATIAYNQFIEAAEEALAGTKKND